MVRAFIRIIKFIANHPLASRYRFRFIKRFITYQISKIFNPYPIIYSFTGRTKLIIEHGMSGATGNLYTGLHEFEDMGFLLHVLRAEDVFVDIGANIGSYTVLASGHVGSTTISVEPVPETYLKLQNNIAINFLASKVVSYNIAVGSEEGTLKMTFDQDTVNHVQPSQETGDGYEVGVNTLDNILDSHDPFLLKIDVEGFETEVLKGANKILQSVSLVAIIIELNGSGKRYGFNEFELHQSLVEYGFSPYKYDPFRRKITERKYSNSGNTIYIKDVDLAINRVQNAMSFDVDGISI